MNKIIASSVQVLHHHNTNIGIIYQYCKHISPYPKITHFEKLLLNNTLKDMGLAKHFSASINSVSSRRERKIINFVLFILPKKFILSIEQQNASSKFHSVSFIPHLCIKLIANKLQHLPCKVSRKFSVGFGDYLIILVQHGASIS